MSELRYRIRHRTAYKYTGRIDLCHSLLHLLPCDQPGQEVLAHRLDISPEPSFRSERKDYFGNGVHYFSIQQSHDFLDVTSVVTVVKTNDIPQLPESKVVSNCAENRLELASKFESGIPLHNFLTPTQACPSIPELDLFLEPTLETDRDIMSVAHELMTRIYEEFEYKPGATENSTPLSEVLRNKSGVCQDFAHVMIAALRRLGIPARYVSGYLETVPPPGQEKLQGADATHAWVEVYSLDKGWVGFDPTNNRKPGHQHIKICHGRDYFDVQPLRGTFVGSGAQKLIVEVDVERM